MTDGEIFLSIAVVVLLLAIFSWGQIKDKNRLEM